MTTYLFIALGLLVVILVAVTVYLFIAISKGSAAVAGFADSIPDAVFIINKKGLIEHANKKAEELFGHTLYDMKGKNITFIMPQPFNTEHEQYMANYLKTGIRHVIGKGREVVAKRKDDTTFPAFIYVNEIQLLNKKLFAGVIYDISDEKRAVEKIRINQPGFATAQKLERMTKTGYMEWNPSTNEFFWSHELYRIFGLDPKNFTITYTSFINLVDEKDREGLKQFLSSEIKDNAELRFSVTLAEDIHKDILIQFNPSLGEGSEKLTGTIRDISDMVAAETREKDALAQKELTALKLNESNLRFYNFFYQNPDACYIETPEGLVMKVNDSLSELVGQPKDSFLGKNIKDTGIWENSSDRDALLNELGDRSYIENKEYRFRAGPDKLISVLCSVQKIEVNEEKQFLYIIKDISKIKELEANIVSDKKEFELLVQKSGEQVNKIDLLEAELSVRTTERDELQKELSETKVRIASLDEEMKSGSIRMDGQDSQIHTLQAELNAEKEKSSLQKSELEQKLADIIKLQQEIDNKSSLLKESEAKYEHTSSELKKTGDKLAIVEKELESVSSKYSDIQKGAGEIDNLYQKIRSELDTKSARLAELEPQLKILEEKLDVSGERFQNFFYLNPLGCFIETFDGIFIETNKKFSEITGYQEEETIDKSLVEIPLWEAPEERKVILARLNKENSISGIETRMKTKAGKVIDVLYSSHVINIGGEKNILSMIDDITKFKEVQELSASTAPSVPQAENKDDKLVRIELLANLNHEIRTPLNTIVGTSELLIDTPLTTEQRQYLTILKQSIASLRSLSDDITDITKLESSQVKLEDKEFNIMELLEKLGDDAFRKASNKGIAFAYHSMPDVPDYLVGDREYVSKLIEIIIDNAVKYTENGEIFLIVKNKTPSDKDSVELMFEVRDTGIGISEEKLPFIFDRFAHVGTYTTQKYGGSGFGLSIAKKLTELMGGKIWVDSKEGKGSTFSFVIRLKPSAPHHDKKVVFPMDLYGLKTLVVAQRNNKYESELNKMLSAWGVLPYVTYNIVNGIEELHNAAKQEKVYQLLFLDRSNMAMLMEIEKDPHHLSMAIVILTEDYRKGELGESYQHGATGYLVYPFKEFELSHIVNEAISHKAMLELERTRYGISQSVASYPAQDDIVKPSVQVPPQSSVESKTAEIKKEEPVAPPSQPLFIPGKAIEKAIPDISPKKEEPPAPPKPEPVVKKEEPAPPPLKPNLNPSPFGPKPAVPPEPVSTPVGQEPASTPPVPVSSLVPSVGDTEKAAITGKNILVVDDAQDNRELIRLYFKDTPHKIDIAEHGAIAVNKYKNNQYDLILMDVQMPFMDGYTATRTIRKLENEQKKKAVPIIALTATTYSTDRERSIEVGCNDFLVKPINKATLLELVAKHLA